MNSTSDACCNEVANFFNLMLPREVSLDVRFWCENKFPAWQIAILVSLILQEGSGRTSHRNQKRQQEIEHAVLCAKTKTTLSARRIQRTITSLFPEEVKQSEWERVRDKIFSEIPRPSIELIAYIFEIFLAGRIKSEHELKSAIAAFFAPINSSTIVPGS